jgi:hypothetical protein
MRTVQVGGPLAILGTVARVVLTAWAVLSALAEARSPAADDARAFLSASLKVTPDDIRRVDGGQTLSRSLDVSDKREVDTVGIVRIEITPEFYVARLADIANFKRDEAVLQIGTFSDPPGPGDVVDLTLDDADIRSLRGCRVGNCGLQLPADAIERFRTDVDWHRSDAPRQANAIMREMLVEYVAKYRKAGAAACMEYADQGEPLHLAREFHSLSQSDLGGWHRFPDLRRYLLEYPLNNQAGFDDLLYWSKEKVGHRGVLSVTHVVISRAASESPADYAVASKQLYGSHYYDASLGLTILLRDRTASSAATYLVYVNRSRLDVFNGLFGGVTRKIVSAKARSTVADQLARLKRTLERQFSNQPR